MAEMMYCPNCGRNVNVTKWTGTRILILIVLLILGIIFGLIYLIYVATRKESCPVCGTPAGMLQAPRYSTGSQAGTSAGMSACPSCGTSVPFGSEYCAECGAKLR
ncbi:zinc ribbon domain-containing protein [Methanomassiliicoccales archaeon LGM-DZ1]|nr:zinc ribbon domain-containing protein [Methanomassiliicoccales archaeon LGM-DZ1]